MTPHPRATGLWSQCGSSGIVSLGSLIHCTGDSAPEIKRRVSITRNCTMALDRNIWRSRISVATKLRLYNSCILSIFLYGAETWAVTATAAKTFDALDQRCLRRILNIFYTGQSASPTTRSEEPNNHYCLTQSAPDAFASLITSAELTPVRIILGHCTPVLLVCQALEEKTRPAETDLVTNYRE